jgi:hypothetical protein
MKKEEFKKLFKIYYKKVRPGNLLLLLEQAKEASAQAKQICEKVLRQTSNCKDNNVNSGK